MSVLYGSTSDPGTAGPAAVTNTWGRSSALTGISLGTGSQNRIGDRIFVKRIQFHITIVPEVNNAMGDGARCRVAVYHNKIANGALPAVLNIWDYDRIDTMRNTNKSEALSVLRDHYHQMVATSVDATSNIASVGPQLTFEWNIYPRKRVSFQDGTANITSILQDDYGFMVCADTAACCNVLCVRKIFYTDA